MANREVGKTSLLGGGIGSASAYCHRKTIGKMNTHAKQRVPAQVPGKESLDDSSLDSESQGPQEHEIVGLADREN